MDFKKRAKNPVFWVGFVGALFTLLRTLGIKVVELDSATVETLVYGIFSLLAVAGVAIDPTTSGITDKK